MKLILQAIKSLFRKVEASIPKKLSDLVNDMKFPTSDWNQNDPDGEGYIANRPFYGGVKVLHDVVVECNVSLSHDAIGLVSGKTYTVVVDGIEYESTAYFDDTDVMNCITFSTDSCSVMVYDRYTLLNGDCGGSHSITVLSYEITRLDYAYLPEQLVRSVNGNTGEVSLTAANLGAAASANPRFTGSFSHNRKSSTTVGESSFAAGLDCTADNYVSHAEGKSTISRGYGSHSEGWNTFASGHYSHAEGQATYTYTRSQHVQGEHNIRDDGTYTSQSTRGTYAHIVGNGTSAAALSNAHTLDWDGNATFAGAVTGSGADYAEYFEWVDGNPNDEDRVGLIVALDGEKIRPANPEDEILGVVSGTAMVVGDNAEWEWRHKYIVDDYGRPVTELVEEFIEVPNEETGEMEQQSVGFFPHRKPNPEYDPEKAYARRSDRPEWEIIGLLGKIHVTDDGTCVVGGYATVGANGIATASTEKTNMRVMKRISDTIILVFMK